MADGYFVLSGSNNCHLRNCQISNSTDVDIWLENVANSTVIQGCVNRGTNIGQSANLINNLLQIQWRINPLSQLLSRVITSTQELINNAKVSMVIYPNPVRNTATIRLADSNIDNTTIKLFDISGKLVIKTTVTGTESTLDLSMLEPGMYIVQAIGKNTTSKIDYCNTCCCNPSGVVNLSHFLSPG